MATIITLIHSLALINELTQMVQSNVLANWTKQVILDVVNHITVICICTSLSMCALLNMICLPIPIILNGKTILILSREGIISTTGRARDIMSIEEDFPVFTKDIRNSIKGSINHLRHSVLPQHLSKIILSSTCKRMLPYCRVWHLSYFEGTNRPTSWGI